MMGDLLMLENCRRAGGFRIVRRYEKKAMALDFTLSSPSARAHS